MATRYVLRTFNDGVNKGLLKYSGLPTLVNQNGKRSISAWVRMAPDNAGSETDAGIGRTIVCFEDGSGNRSTQLCVCGNNAGDIAFVMRTTTPSTYYRQTGANALGTIGGTGLASRNYGWHHVAVTFNGTDASNAATDVKWYVDGEEITGGTPSSPTGTLNAIGGVCRIGAQDDTGTFPWSGGVAEVALYDRALSLSEVQQLADFKNPIVPTALTGCKFYVSCNASTGAGMTDAVNSVVPTVSNTGGSNVVPIQIDSLSLMRGCVAAYYAELGVTSSSGAISQWNDYAGGQLHLTQGTGANKPNILSADPILGTEVTHYSGTSSPTSTTTGLFLATTGDGKNGFASQRFSVVSVARLRLIAGTSGAGQDGGYCQTLFAAGAAGAAPKVALKCHWENSLGTPANIGKIRYEGTDNTAGVLANTRWTTNPMVYGLRATSDTNLDVNRGGDTKVSATRTAPTDKTTMITGWRIGADTTTGTSDNCWSGAEKTVILFSQELNDTDYAWLRSQLESRYALPSAPSMVIAIEGSSSPAGFQSTQAKDILTRCSFAMSRSYAHNMARGGDQIGVPNGGAGAAGVEHPFHTTNLDALVQSGKRNVLILMLVSTNLFGGLDAAINATDDTLVANVWNEVKSYCTARKAAGWNSIVMIDILDRKTSGPNDPAKDAEFDYRRNLFNNTVKANGAGYVDYIVRANDLPHIGGDTAIDSNPSYFNADVTHLSDLGFDELGPAVNSVLNNAFGDSGGTLKAVLPLLLGDDTDCLC